VRFFRAFLACVLGYLFVTDLLSGDYGYAFVELGATLVVVMPYVLPKLARLLTSRRSNKRRDLVDLLR